MKATFLSAISEQFSKSLIMGTFAPTALFVILGLLVVPPLFPARVTWFSYIETLESGWQLFALTLLVVVLSLLLYGLNIPIIRIYEGYPWFGTWIGQLRTRYYQEQFDELKTRWWQLATLINTFTQTPEITEADKQAAIQVWAKNPNVRRSLPDVDWEELDNHELDEDRWSALLEQIKREFAHAELERIQNFPQEKDHILPTRLGNIIRAFEEYSFLAYGIDAVALWPLLIAVVEAPYLSAIEEAKTQFDFMLNCSVLSSLMVILVGVLGVIYPLPGVSPGLFLLWLVLLAALVALAYWFYLQAIPQADNWGNMVRGAFDLYRKTLLQKLGYKQEFRRRTDEKALWEQIQVAKIYGRTASGSAPDYDLSPSPPPTYAIGQPGGQDMEVTRGHLPEERNGQARVFIQVKNIEAEATYEKLVVRDTLPDHWFYRWDSASASQGKLSVTGRNPLTFTVEEINLEPGQSLTVTYTAMLLNDSKEN